MKPAQVKPILRQSATLAPAQARRIVSALAAKAADPTPEEFLAEAQETLEGAMGAAVLAMLEQTLATEEP